MKKLAPAMIAFGALTFAGLTFAEPALANDHEAKPKVEVIERDDRGKATKVMIDGKEYIICTPQVQDSCINPRSAGLDFGNRELDYWPGKPASAD